MANKAVVIAGIALAVACTCGSLWFSYGQYLERSAAADNRITLTQEQMDAASSKIAEQEAARLEQIISSLPPIESRPAPKPEASKPEDEYVAVGDETVVERPEFNKPEPPPPPSVPDEEKQDPNSKPQNPEPPKPSNKPSKGDTRVTADGRTEKYMGDHFGWVEHSPGGTHIAIDNSGWEDSPVVGH